MNRAQPIERATIAQSRINRTRAYAETWLSLIHHDAGRYSLVRDYDFIAAVTLATRLDVMAAAIDARDCPAAMDER